MGKKTTFTLRRGLALVFALTFLVSGGLLVRDLLRARRERAANEELVRRVEQAVPQTQPSAGDSSSGSDPEPEQPQRNYAPLVQENGDLAAWLTIPDTQVDYPVLYTPENPEYYLRRAFDGSYALSGSLFIGDGCTPDGSNVIIYGHRMNDHTMFGDLERYADETYAREHGEILYDRISPDCSCERHTFTVLAAFYSRVYSVDEEGVFRYYYGTDLSDPDAFEDYVNQAKAACPYDLGVTAEYGDRLLTLSTCSYYTDDGRFVVVAREEAQQHSQAVP